MGFKTLKIQKNGVIQGGEVTYIIGSDNVLDWAGHVIMKIGLLSRKKEFYGRYPIDPQLLDAKTYKNSKGPVRLGNVEVETLELTPTHASTLVKVLDQGVEGRVCLYTTDGRVSVKNADLRMDAAGLRLAIRVEI